MTFLFIYYYNSCFLNLFAGFAQDESYPNPPILVNGYHEITLFGRDFLTNFHYKISSSL